MAEIDRLDVVHARGIGHQQPGDHRQAMTTVHGEHRHVGLDAQRADRIGRAECKDEGRRLVLHSA
jgi:hypothetical protein